jgi:hypothetical protein
MAYLCVDCIEKHGLVDSNHPVGLGFGRTGTCEGYCEACQPIYFGWLSGAARDDGIPKHTIWVPWVERSLDDPEAIQRQLAEADCAMGVVAFFAWLLGRS